MINRWSIAFISFFSFTVFWLSGCQSKVPPPPNPTPTEAVTHPAATVEEIFSGPPRPVTLLDLANNPTAYADQKLILSGQLGIVSGLDCPAEQVQGPSRWWLASGETLILVHGFETQVTHLLPSGLTMNVIGWWKEWQGPVGCGENSSEQSLWYLAASEILEPNPLARVTLTPAGPTVVAAASPVLATATAPPPPPSPNGLGSPTVTPTRRQIPTFPGTAAASSTPSPGLTASPTSSVTPSRTAVAPSTGTPATAVPSATPSPQISTTPTPTRNPDMTPTATRSLAFSIIPKGNLDIETDPDAITLAGGGLASGEIHSYQFTLTSSSNVTIQLIGSPGNDLVLSLLDSAGVLIEQNNVSGGEVEIIQDFPLTGGSYEIQVRDSAGGPGHYLVTVRGSGSFVYLFQSLLNYGEVRTDMLLDDNDHLWFFMGLAGENITITAVSTDNGDLFLTLFSPDASMLDEVDDGLEGEPEIFPNISLPVDGLYAIQVGEYNFIQASYMLTISLN